MSVTTCNCKNPKKSLNPYFDYAWKMICEREKYNWPMEVQIQFEKADMANNTDYFKKNWDQYHEQFASHSLATNGVFEWNNFRRWLRANPNLINVKTYLEEFEKNQKNNSIDYVSATIYNRLMYW